MNWKDFKDTPTTTLIEYIRLKTDPKALETAKAAFNAFCFRFEAGLQKKVVVIIRNYGYDDEFAIEIIERTFERFWLYPNYKPEKLKADTHEKGVELYLSRIAQHCFYDLYNERNGIKNSPYDGNEEIIYDISIPEEYIKMDRGKYLILTKALASFSWKHRVVYLTYLQHEKDGYKLPRKLLTELRDKLGVTQDTIRFYRYEVISKIKEFTDLWQEKEKI